MRRYEVEAWARHIFWLLDADLPVANPGVELKSEWLPPETAARQIAGHANAAYGEPILWLIGVDESKGIVGVDPDEALDWFAAVKDQFDGPAPRLRHCHSLRTNNKTITALLFETDLAPFVVKNPLFGAQEGENISLEIPWRKGSSTRTASRAELLRILFPSQSIPVIEVLDGNLRAGPVKGGGTICLLELHLYAEVHDGLNIVIPFHRCRGLLDIPEGLNAEFERVELTPPRVSRGSDRGRSLSLTMRSTPTEIILNGSGKVILEAKTWQKSVLRLTDRPKASIDVSIQPANIARTIPIVCSLTMAEPDKNAPYSYEWFVRRNS